MRAFLDPAQTKALGQVFDKAALGIGGHSFTYKKKQLSPFDRNQQLFIINFSSGAFDFYRCGCHPGQQKWVRPLEVPL